MMMVGRTPGGKDAGWQMNQEDPKALFHRLEEE
jgi:hypothetical protein